MTQRCKWNISSSNKSFPYFCCIRWSSIHSIHRSKLTLRSHCKYLLPFYLCGIEIFNYISGDIRQMDQRICCVHLSLLCRFPVSKICHYLLILLLVFYFVVLAALTPPNRDKSSPESDRTESRQSQLSYLNNALRINKNFQTYSITELSATEWNSKS